MVQKIGLEAVLNIGQFNASAKIFIGSIDKMNSSIGKMAKDSSKSFTSMEGALDRIGSSFRRIRDIVTGVLVIDVFRKLSGVLGDLKTQAIDAVDVFQRLTIRFQTLAAIDFAEKFGGSVTDALDQVNDKVQETLGWVRKMAVTTPFSVASISNALAYAQAFGFVEDAAKRLTLATGDFVAGMGLTDENMQRIIWNFGQMMASGRVLGREIRDLANNMVPVMKITEMLAEEYEVTTEAMKKMMKEGVISAEEFIGTFVMLAETQFEGAMERMVKTITGVRQNIKDFIDTIFGMEMLGPVLDKVTAGLAGLLESLFSDKTLRMATGFGLALANVYDIITQSVKGTLIPAIRDLFSTFGIGAPTVYTFASAIIKAGLAVKFMIDIMALAIRGVARFVESISSMIGTNLGDIANDAESWGANIIISFARGMANALSYILNVLTRIAQIFTKWLRGSSPPKLLPDLDKWGSDAMKSYMEGWASADFGIFEDIAGKIANYIRSIRPEIDETNIIPRILGGREGISAAIDEVRRTGVVTESVLDGIFKKAGITSEALREYVKLMLNLEAASKQAAEAQKLLDFDLDMDISVTVFDTIVNDIESMRKAAEGFKGSIRDSVFAYIDALEAQAKATQAASEAQENLDSVTQHYDDVLTDLRRQLDALNDTYDDSTRLHKIENALVNERLTNEERLRLETERSRMLLQRQIRDTENFRDIEEDAAKDRLDEAEEVADSAEDNADRQQQAAENLVDSQLDALKEQVAAQEGLVKAITDTNELWAKQLELLARLEEAAKAEAGGAGDLTPEDDEWEEFWGGFDDTITASADDIEAAIDALTAKLRIKFDKFLLAIKEPFKGVGDEIRILVADWTDAFEEFTGSENFKLIEETITGFVENIKTGFGNLRQFWEDNGPAILEVISGFMSDLSEALGLKGAGESALTGLLGIIDSLGESFVTLSQNLVDNGPQIVENLRAFGKSITEELIPDLQDKWKWIKEEFIPSIIELGSSAATWLPPAALALASIAGSIALLNVSPAPFEMLGTAIRALSILPFVAPALEGISVAFTAIGTAISGAASSGLLLGFGIALGVILGIVLRLGIAFVLFKKNIGGFGDNMKILWGRIKKSLEPALKDLSKAWDELKVAFDELKPVLDPFLEILKDIGAVLLEVFAGGLFVLIATGVGWMISVITAGIDTLTFVVGAVTGVVEGVKLIIQGVVEFVTGLIEFLMSKSDDGEAQIAGLVKMAKGILKIFSGIFKSIVNIFKIVFGTMINFVAKFVKDVIEFFKGLFNDLVGNSIITDMMTDMWDTITTGLDDILESIKTWITDIIQNMTDAAVDFLAKGKEWIDNLTEGIKERFIGEDGLITKFGAWLQETIDKISEKFEAMKKAGGDLLQKLIDGIKSKVEDLATSIKETISDALDIVKQNLSDWYNIGKAMIESLIDGLWARATDLADAITDIARSAFGWLWDWMVEKFGGGGDRPDSEDEPQPGDPDFDPDEAWGSSVSTTGISTGVTANAFIDAIASALSTALQSAPISQNIIVAPASTLGIGTSIGTQDNSINVDVDASYADVQSEADIYSDVSAALSTFRR